MANPDIGYITREALVALLPEKIPLRKNPADGKKYPLYIASPFGAWFFNNFKGQDALLDHGHVFGAVEAEPVVQVMDSVPEIREGVTAAESEKPQEKAAGFFDWLSGGSE